MAIQTYRHNKLVEHALRSVAEQTEQPQKVFISHSGEANTSEWQNALGYDIELKTFETQSDNPYKYLSQFVKDKDTVFFLSPSDLYDINFIKSLKPYMTRNNLVRYKHKRFGLSPLLTGAPTSVIEADKQVELVSGNTKRLWTYATTGKALKEIANYGFSRLSSLNAYTVADANYYHRV